MDVLSDAITAMRTGRPHSTLNRMAAPWGTRFPASDAAGFHVVLQGSGWLLPADGPPLALSTGDVVFMPKVRGYGLADRPDTPLVAFQPGRSSASASSELGGEPSAVLLCGAYTLDRVRPHPLLAELPHLIHLPARVGRHPSLRSAVDLLGRELAESRPGSSAVVTALLDLLLLYIIRAWLDDHPDVGWAAALRDPAIASALHAIHADPARPWTVEALGAEAGLSRAAFSKRFTALVGQPVLAYVTWWRMVLAARLLRETDAPLAAVAVRAGYGSEFAFGRAFKREFGVSPGLYRVA